MSGVGLDVGFAAVARIEIAISVAGRAGWGAGGARATHQACCGAVVVAAGRAAIAAISQRVERCFTAVAAESVAVSKARRAGEHARVITGVPGIAGIGSGTGITACFELGRVGYGLRVLAVARQAASGEESSDCNTG